MVEQFAYCFKVKIDFFFWREFFGLYEFMVLHAGIGLVVVSTKSVPLQLKESPFTFFSTHLSRLVKILRQCCGKNQKKAFRCSLPPNFRILFYFPQSMCFIRVLSRGWQTNYSHIVLVFIKKHLTDYFISTLITNYYCPIYTGF